MEAFYFGLRGVRTLDQLIKSQLLYQLSYKPLSLPLYYTSGFLICNIILFNVQLKLWLRMLKQ